MIKKFRLKVVYWIELIVAEYIRKKFVFCETCKYTIHKGHAQEVIATTDNAVEERFYYCPQHKKPYDSIVKSFWAEPDRYFTKLTPKEVEVTEEGEPIKK